LTRFWSLLTGLAFSALIEVASPGWRPNRGEPAAWAEMFDDARDSFATGFDACRASRRLRDPMARRSAREIEETAMRRARNDLKPAIIIEPAKPIRGHRTPHEF
jgi:hypothetical protein